MLPNDLLRGQVEQRKAIVCAVSLVGWVACRIANFPTPASPAQQHVVGMAGQAGDGRDLCKAHGRGSWLDDYAGLGERMIEILVQNDADHTATPLAAA